MQIRSLDRNLSLIEIFDVNVAEDALLLYPAINGFRFNYVISGTNSTTPLSSVHSNSVDRLFLKAIRHNADLIITTGLTARSENLSAPTTTPLLILTKETNLDIPATRNPSTVSVLVTNEQSNQGNPASKSIGFIGGPLDDYLIRLQLEYGSIALEVGLDTARKMNASHLINEVCLTITGVKTGEIAIERLKKFLKSIDFSGNIQHILNFETTWLFRVISRETLSEHSHSEQDFG